MPLVAEFLEHLFQRTPPLAIDTIRGYPSALSSTLYNVVDLTNSVFLRNLLKNMDLQRPKYKELCPKWNIALVLVYITSPPFEPIMKASLWHLMLKTVFLLKLAWGWRRNILLFQGRRGSGYPHYRIRFLGQEPETPRLYTSDSYPRTKEPEVRCGRTRLFLNPKKPESDISMAHISTWIKKLVQDAHEHAGVEHLCLAKVSAQIMQAVYWKSQATFTSFYLKAMATQAERLFALGPIVVAQTVIQPPGASSDEELMLSASVLFPVEQ